MQSDTEGFQLPKRERNPDDGELDITPMIDVTFLLLAFFVVVSKMDPQASVPLPMASYGQSIPDKNCVTIIVTVDETGQTPNVFLGSSMKDETLVPPGDPEDQEQVIADFVENELSTYPNKDAILVKGAGDCKTGMIQMVKRGVAQSPLAEQRKVYIGVEEEQ